MNRRQLLISGASAVALAVAPAVAVAAPATPFVPPTTNIVHLAGRIGQKYRFNEREVLQLLGLDPSTFAVAVADDVKSKEFFEFCYSEPVYESVDVARSLAEDGAHDIYERARQIIGIKRKLNLHFNFDAYDETRWLDTPNPHLRGLTFRSVMTRNLRLATEVIDRALAT